MFQRNLNVALRIVSEALFWGETPRVHLFINNLLSIFYVSGIVLELGIQKNMLSCGRQEILNYKANVLSTEICMNRILRKTQSVAILHERGDRFREGKLIAEVRGGYDD